jgi:hypothetical protein
MGWKVLPPSKSRAAVVAVFDGYLSAEQGKASSAAFRAAFGDDRREVVWDVTGMTGFDGAARVAWADVVWPVRKRISRLQIIGATGVVKVGALFLALLLRAPFEFVEADEYAASSR